MSEFIQDDFDVVDYEAGAADDIRGQECRCCFRLLKWNFFRRDSSMKQGHALQCLKCEEAPRLSMAEHTARLREDNFNSHGTRRQRHIDQDEMRKDRRGRTMDASLFLQKLLHVCPNLYVTQGGVVGDLAIYVTSGVPKSEWAGASFKYLGYVTLGTMPEFSKYEFDEKNDIMLRASEMGWRSVLIRFVENNILTEQQIIQEFGHPSGGENSLWYKHLHNYRNSNKLI